ncbi:MAG TPA: SdpI family protein [Gemmatimonadaceae bacterium]|nr:SdpI family protein [Gemmatimonadaceae bacterium]
MRSGMRKWYPAVLVVAAFAVAVAAYPRLPARVPVHWDIHGDVNGYGSRFVAAYLQPLIMLGIAILIPILPKIDPRARNYEKFGASYELIFSAVLTIVFVIYLVTLASALGKAVPITRIVPALVGVLLVVIGNVLPRVRSNWMVGIRTPWTLSSDGVWERTHRVGGYLLMLAGAALLLASLTLQRETSFVIGFGGVVLASLATVVYSYVAWRREPRP